MNSNRMVQHEEEQLEKDYALLKKLEDEYRLKEGVLPKESLADQIKKLKEKIKERETQLVPKRKFQDWDWGEAPDVSELYGREQQLDKLKQWILDEQCRLVALVGLRGIGKTALAVKLAQQIQDNFKYIIWRSLIAAPPIEKILAKLLEILSNQQEIERPESEPVSEKITRLIQYLGEARCLLVLDNFETIFQSGEPTGSYLKGYEGYGDLLRRVGESPHKSCLIITSREKPNEILTMAGERYKIRYAEILGLGYAEIAGLDVDVAPGKEVFEAKCPHCFKGSDEDWKTLIKHYSGNPLALKLATPNIQDMTKGDVSKFVNEALKKGYFKFNNIDDLLFRELKERLSDLEKQVIYWLAIEIQPVILEDLGKCIPHSQGAIWGALTSLSNRSLIESTSVGYTLQNVIREYFTNKLIEQVIQEIQDLNFNLFNSHALMKATAKDYVRETQERLILKPIITHLVNANNKLNDCLNKLRSDKLRLKEKLPKVYAAGNILNLLRYITSDISSSLSNHDLSHLDIWQAYFQEVNLRDVDFTDSDLSNSVFSQSFGSILSVTFSPDGKLLAAGDSNREICLWEVENWQFKLKMTLKGHSGWVWSVAFNPQRNILASGAFDNKVKLWNIDTGQCLKTLEEHTNIVRFVALFQFARRGSECAKTHST